LTLYGVLDNLITLL